MKKLSKKKSASREAMIALFLIFLMGGSTIAYSFISSLRQPQKKILLPKSLILERDLTQDEESAILRTYRTIIKFHYRKDCTACLNLRNVLERVVENSGGQVYLVEIEGELNRIDIYNALYSTTLENLDSLDEKTLKKSICNILVDPPNWCLNYLV